MPCLMFSSDSGIAELLSIYIELVGVPAELNSIEVAPWQCPYVKIPDSGRA